MQIINSKIPVFCGVLSAILGALVLFAWHAHLTAIIQVFPNFVVMMYNTALCFLISGIALAFLSYSYLRTADILAVLVIFLSGTVLLQYLLDKDLGIDQLFFKHYITIASPHPGRMAPNTALCFVLVSLAMLTVKNRRKRNWFFKGLVGMTALALSTTALFSYLLKLEPGVGWGGDFSLMALNTSIGLVTLSTGVIAFAWVNESEKVANTPRWLPLLAAVGVLTVTISFWKAMDVSDRLSFEAKIKLRSLHFKEEIMLHMGDHVHALNRMANHWQINTGQVNDKLRTDAAFYIKDHPGCLAILWIDTSNIVHWIEPMQGNEKLLGRDIGFEEHRITAINLTKNTGGTIISHPVDLAWAGIGRGLWLISPIFTDNVYEGSILTIMQSQTLLETFLADEDVQGVNLVILDNADKIYSHGNIEKEQIKWVQDLDVPLPGTVWHLQVGPDRDFIASKSSSLTKSILIFGLLMSVLLALAIRLMQKLWVTADELVLHRTHLKELVAQRTEEVGKTNKLLIEENRARKTVEDALAKSLQEQEIIFATNPDIIYVADMHGKVMKWNKTMETVTGYSHDELMGKPGTSFFAPADADRVAEAIQRVLTTGKAEVEANFIGKGGALIPYLFNAAILCNDRGETIGFTGTGRDISELKRSDEKLKKVNEQLMHIEKLSALGKLTGSIAHEFNNPLYGVLNIVEQTMEEKELSEEIKGLLRLAVKECHRMADLIRKLREFYRPTAGINSLVDVHQVMDEVLLLIKKDLLTRNINLEKHYHPAPLQVVAIEDQMKQVFLNILQNAAEAINKGGTITIVTEAFDTSTRITISDTGEGVSEDNLSLIFEPFFTTKAVKGTGLGLAVCYSIVKAHGGEINVQSKEGQGTTFIITLPAGATR